MDEKRRKHLFLFFGSIVVTSFVLVVGWVYLPKGYFEMGLLLSMLIGAIYYHYKTSKFKKMNSKREEDEEG